LQELLSLVRRCVEDYNMIEDGDKIAVGVSGGKDSLTLLCVLRKLADFFPKRFEIVAITLDMGYNANFSPVAALCREIDVEYHIIPTNIKEVIFDIRNESNPCSLCAKMRRGALHEAAISLGCNKVALGHHSDDVLETFMLSLIYEGRVNCFMPTTYLDRKKITMIRPMLYVPENKVRCIVKKLALPVVHNPCPANGNSKRQEIKDLIYSLDKKYKGFKVRLFGAIQRYPLKGWEKQP